MALVLRHFQFLVLVAQETWLDFCCLSRSCSVPRKGGSAVFSSQNPPSQSLLLPGLSLPSSKSLTEPHLRHGVLPTGQRTGSSALAEPKGAPMPLRTLGLFFLQPTAKAV